MDQDEPKPVVPRPWLVALGIVGTFVFLIAVLPRARMVQIQSTPGRIKADICTIKEALDAYAMQHGGDYPNSLDALVAPDEHGHRYLNLAKVPKDPWNEAYGYERPTPAHPQPRVYTLGRDKSIGGTGDDADVDYLSIVNGG